jgi:glutathione synthase/RimK-type ligase-like ATP-grasp enzyme
MGAVEDLDLSGARLASRNSNVLFLGGSDNNNSWNTVGRNMVAGNTDIFQLLNERVPNDRLQITANYFRYAGAPDLGPYHCVVNIVSDPDLNPQVLGNIRKILRGYRGKIINPPDAVMRTTREQVARRLTGVPGLIVPKAARFMGPKANVAAIAIERAGLEFPVILRLAGTHTGKVIGLFETLEDLQKAVTTKKPHIATEFIDYRSLDGLYRKYRVFFIGERRIFRHLIGADDWNIHAKARFAFMTHHPGLIDEEQRILEQPDGVFPPSVAATLDVVRERIGLDFFGLDFGIAPDGQVVLFEANATMNFFPVGDAPPFTHIQKVLRPAHLAFCELLGISATE